MRWERPSPATSAWQGYRVAAFSRHHASAPEYNPPSLRNAGGGHSSPAAPRHVSLTLDLFRVLTSRRH